MSYPIKEIAGVACLGESNYSQWKADMQAALMLKGCWRIVNGSITAPTDASELEEWQEKHVAPRWLSGLGPVLSGLAFKPRWCIPKSSTRGFQ